MAPRDYSLKRLPASDSHVNRAELYTQFPDDNACLEWLRIFRWPDGIPCAACGKVTPHYRVKDRPSYSCQSCGHHVHPTAGTIFHKSSTSLRMWFEAIFLMSATRCGISAKQLEREIRVTYKTAWRMFGLIRTLLADDDTPLDGKVEVDETYFAKSATKRLGGGSRPGCSPGERTVLGMAERRGRVVALHVPDAKTATVLPHIKSRVLPGAMVLPTKR
jgi:transposase